MTQDKATDQRREEGEGGRREKEGVARRRSDEEGGV